MRGPAYFDFGTACSQRIWHAPPITSRSPEPGVRSRDLPPPFGPQQERAARAEGHDRDAACRRARAARGRRARRRCRCRRGSSCSAGAEQRTPSCVSSARADGRRARDGEAASPRAYQRERRGSSSMRSYMWRRPCFQSTRFDRARRAACRRRAASRARSSTHDASSSSMRSKRACVVEPGLTVAEQRPLEHVHGSSVANVCSLLRGGRVTDRRRHAIVDIGARPRGGAKSREGARRCSWRSSARRARGCARVLTVLPCS